VFVQLGPAKASRMTRALALISALLLAAPATAQERQRDMSLEQRMQLRCSAAFAIVANEQQRGIASARAYPPLGERGKEYFVRAGARLIDELGLSREQLQALLKTEVEALQARAMEAGDPAAFVDSVMQPCLTALEASGL